MIEPFDAFRFYQALKLHFTSDSYDAVKYNYKTRVKEQSFWKRKDKYFYAKAGRKFNSVDDLIKFYACHFISGNSWIGEMLNDEESYRLWQLRNQSLTYKFSTDISTLASNCDSFDSLFDIGNNMPKIIEMYLADEIMIETVSIIHSMTGFIKKTKVDDTILWPELSRKILKYTPFVSFDSNKFKDIIIKEFTIA